MHILSRFGDRKHVILHQHVRVFVSKSCEASAGPVMSLLVPSAEDSEAVYDESVSLPITTTTTTVSYVNCVWLFFCCFSFFFVSCLLWFRYATKTVSSDS